MQVGSLVKKLGRRNEKAVSTVTVWELVVAEGAVMLIAGPFAFVIALLHIWFNFILKLF